VIPLFAAHGDDAEIGVSGAGLWIDGEDPEESRFRTGQVAGLKGSLAFCKGGLGVDGSGGRGVPCGVRGGLLRCRMGGAV